MIVRAIAQLSGLFGKVEAIDIVVAFGKTVERGFHVVEGLSVEHRACQQYNLGLWLEDVEMGEEFLICRLEKFDVVVVQRGVVGAEVDADDVGAE